VNKLLVAANISLLLALAGLGFWNMSLWTHPAYPDRVDGAAVTPPPRDPPAMPVARKPYSPSAINVTTQSNLFREERKPLIVQTATQNNETAAASQPEIPPPNLTLRGVILMNGVQLALLEGSYPVAQPGAQVMQKPLTHKGYGVGARIGEYKVTRIEKTGITLGNAKGEVLNLKLEKFPTEQLVFPAGTKAEKPKTINQKAAKTNASQGNKNGKPSRESRTRASTK